MPIISQFGLIDKTQPRGEDPLSRLLQTPLAGNYHVGDVLFAIPRHVCPTTALHKRGYVAEAGRVTGQWEVTSRDRQITI